MCATPSSQVRTCSPTRGCYANTWLLCDYAYSPMHASTEMRLLCHQETLRYSGSPLAARCTIPSFPPPLPLHTPSPSNYTPIPLKLAIWARRLRRESCYLRRKKLNMRGVAGADKVREGVCEAARLRLAPQRQPSVPRPLHHAPTGHVAYHHFRLMLC